MNTGDILEFNRGFFSHYALNLGNGKVMNVCAEGMSTRSALIKEMRIEEVCRGSQVRIRNHDDVARRYFQVQPKSTFEIIRDAKSFDNQVLPYEFEFRNCEYYSTLWRYGKGFSTQVANPNKTPVGRHLGIIPNGIPSPWKIDGGCGPRMPESHVFEDVIYARYRELARK
ncbi:unnamed protein product [Orchesella dallaii]|uniref:LRAT domain-containing protein n=1 Tax=Orchesella dallaii TaxID=48710 RepID=A0ABP1QPW8_9HEXA